MQVKIISNTHKSDVGFNAVYNTNLCHCVPVRF